MHGQGDGDTGTALRGRLSVPLVVGLALVVAAAAAAGVLEAGRTSSHPAVTVGHHHPPHASGSQGSGTPGPSPPSTTQPATTTPTTGSTALPGVVADCSGPPPTGERTSVEPSSIVVACADDGIFLEDLTWSAWGSQSATASGVLATNDCTPSCAEGTFHSYPASFVLSGPEPAPGGAAFSHLSVTYEGTGLRYPTGRLVTSFTLALPRG